MKTVYLFCQVYTEPIPMLAVFSGTLSLHGVYSYSSKHQLKHICSRKIVYMLKET